MSDFTNHKTLVKMSPFLVAALMAKADGLVLEEEKVIELAHFEEFSLQAHDTSVISTLFLDIHDEEFHEVWEMEYSEILVLLNKLPQSALIVVGTEVSELAKMLETTALQVANADGDIHDLEIAAAHELENIFIDLYTASELIDKVDGQEDLTFHQIIDSVEESQSQNNLD
jgi:hypothetical protein|tara:strand:- start:995 stop:1507 length:513 start_codon:yes stop_codon:yes gene_type:complete